MSIPFFKTHDDENFINYKQGLARVEFSPAQ